VKEECDADLDVDKIKFISCMNILFVEAGYHNVGIFTLATVDKTTFSFRNLEPHKNSDWRWVKWCDFVELTPLFIPFKYFFEAGFKDLNAIKAEAGLNN